MHPYQHLPPECFWKTAVAERDPLAIAGMARFRNKLKKTDVVGTAGSCFAQHIARHLRAEGFNFFDAEPAPSLLPAEKHAAYGYGLFSARYGNIYTSSQLAQLIRRVYRTFVPAERVWRHEGRFYDPFRPSIEPNGFASEAEALASQESHIHAVRRMVKKLDVFVFTLGLTETWRSKVDGAVYPTCPGVIAGTYDPDKYEFINLDFPTVLRDMQFAINHFTRVNPDIRFVLTVSPIPLTATASGEHALPATTYSKSVLRAVAGTLTSTFPHVDYFPSYEIISAPVFGGRFFEANQRSVTPEGVEFVMQTFMRECCGSSVAQETVAPRPAPTAARPVGRSARKRRIASDLVCEEALLEFYAR